jgi:glutathione synthase/RimK-type ligase-like ATP-grasp enzyme
MSLTPCRIAIVTNAKPKDSMLCLIQAAQKKGVVFDIINYKSISLSNFAQSDLAKKLLMYDIVYYRSGMRDTTLSLLTDFCDKNNLPIVNGVRTYSGVHRKIQQAIICAQHNVLHPNTILINTASYAELAETLGNTFVCKPDDGSKGKNVTIVDSEQKLDEVKSLSSPANKFIAQTLITDAKEYRVYTLGSTGITSYRKESGGTDFRANLHTGGSMCKTETDIFEALNTYAGSVATCFEADIAGIDILLKDGKFIVLEVNFQPGWENLKEITNTSLSDDTLDFLISKRTKATN